MKASSYFEIFSYFIFLDMFWNVAKGQFNLGNIIYSNTLMSNSNAKCLRLISFQRLFYTENNAKVKFNILLLKYT